MPQTSNTKQENTSMRSFFDSEDLSAPFDFIFPQQNHEKDLRTPAMIASTLSCQTPGPTYPTRGVFALHGQLLVLYRVHFL